MKQLMLTGLDGANPLGFLAALGTLRLLSEDGGVSVTLSWREEGRWRPVLTTEGEIDLLEQVTKLSLGKANLPEFSLEYQKEGKASKRVRDLKPPPEAFRRFAASAAADSSPRSRRWADFAAAYATDVARDGRGNTKPTALHFTAGQQLFLDMVCEIARAITPDDLEEALLGPWQYKSPLPTLRWDVVGERLYALMASDPSSEKASGVPGADWLALQAMPLFPSFPVILLTGATRVLTTGFEGAGKDFVFRWPLWDCAASLDVVRSLVASGTWRLSAAERRARGITLILESAVKRSDHGYGTFAAPVPA